MIKYFSLLFIMFLFVNFNYVNAEEVGIPEWVFIVYDFWSSGIISDEEFEDMLTYLEERGMIEFIVNYGNDVKMNFLLNIPDNKHQE